MPSLHPGYEYDIFISYRQNDNRSGWVTEFVRQLNEELASTIKEPVSVYFDANPHDGLLETHNVDKSLEGKLKCLIFIPIISQTYCDPKSFAWQYEFCVFNRLAKEDELGRDIKLGNGNVTSRILPVKIHDLDAQDISMLKNEFGGMPRPVEFIFRSSGVNRPLLVNEINPQDNLNKTFYRDQLNKVANAIKEVIAAIKDPIPKSRVTVAAHDGVPSPTRKRKLQIALVAALVLLLSVAAVFTYPKIFPDDEADGGASIAVLYFDNISSDPEQDYFSDGITEEITAHLSLIKGLRVTSRTSVIPFKGKGKAINVREIGQQLNVRNILEGSVRKSGDKLRITAQLIDARTDEHIWTEVYDRDLTDVFKIQSEIAHAIAAKFNVAISRASDEKIASVPTENIKAYELYLKARAIPMVNSEGIGTYYGERDKAKRWLMEAIALDPDFSLAYSHLSKIYLYAPNRDSAEFFAREAIVRNPKSADGYIAMAEIESLENALQWLRKAYALDSSEVLLSMAKVYEFNGKFPEAIRISSYMINSNPVSADPYVLKAQVYAYLAQPDSVEKYLALYDALAPNAREGYAVRMYDAWTRGQIENTKLYAPKYFGDDTLSTNKMIGIACIMAKDWNLAYQYYSRTYYRDMDWGLVLIRLGRKEEGMKTLRESLALRQQEGSWLGDFSRINIVLGNKKEGLDYLRRTLAAGWFSVNFLQNDPFWDEVRQDPEFKKVRDDMDRRSADMLRQIKEDEKKTTAFDL